MRLMSEPRPIVLRTADGLQLAASLWPVGAGEVACVVAHGFTGSSRNAQVQRICRALAGQGMTVLAPDFRGHGRSEGLGTAGADEIHDVAAAVAWLRKAGFRFVALLGWSMGGTAVLRYAGLSGDADAVVSISAPGVWFERGTRPMRLVDWVFLSRAGRAAKRGIPRPPPSGAAGGTPPGGRAATRYIRRTRLSGAGWATVPEAPAEVAGAIAPRPLLIVHGEADHYFPGHHVDALEAAAPAADVWREPNMGHAEVATTADLL